MGTASKHRIGFVPQQTHRDHWPEFVNGQEPCSEIFLSNRGKPLPQQTISHIFGDAARALGWPRGAAIHAWRRAYANNEIEADLDARIEINADISIESIQMSLQAKMRHQSPASQGAYIRDMQRRLRGTATYRDKAENKRLADENTRLKAELIQLRKMLK